MEESVRGTKANEEASVKELERRSRAEGMEIENKRRAGAPLVVAGSQKTKSCSQSLSPQRSPSLTRKRIRIFWQQYLPHSGCGKLEARSPLANETAPQRKKRETAKEKERPSCETEALCAEHSLGRWLWRGARRWMHSWGLSKDSLKIFKKGSTCEVAMSRIPYPPSQKEGFIFSGGQIPGSW